MIINGSTISMSSHHESATYSRFESAEAILTSDEAAAISYSKESHYSAKDQFEQQVAVYEKARSNQRNDNLSNTLRELARINKQNKCEPKTVDCDDEIIIEKILRLLEKLTGKSSKLHEQLEQLKHPNKKEITDPFAGYQSANVLSSSSFSIAASSYSSVSATAAISGTAGIANSDSAAAPKQTVWQKVSASSFYHAELENTSYAATGIAKTADGREINFNVEIGMSRAFQETIDTLSSESIICTDPLVINVGNDVAQISDRKYFFDLDSDGTAEEMSFATNGSGFLAYDKNNDGVINNGNELFGTKSGDGFADLAAYDDDKNGWIDEADSIFSKLKIYTKDENGKDKLINLKDADVGAIYLGNASTEFSLKNDSDNSTNGIIRSTGIYLKESGGVGTVQHVDIAI